MPGRVAPSDAPFTELSARPLGPFRRFLVVHPVAADWLVVAFFALAALPAWAVGDPPAAWRWPAVVAAAGLLLLRRRAPVLVLTATTAVAAAMLAASGSFAGLDLAVALALYAVVANRPMRTAWLSLAAVVSAALLALSVWALPRGGPRILFGQGEDGMPFDLRIGELIGLVVLSVLALAIGISVRHRREHVAALVERANALALDLQRREQLAVSAERTRIAREMHDVVAHSLSVMVALADGATASLDRRPDRAAAALEELSTTGRAALADMRRVLGTLRDGSAPDVPGSEVPDPVDPSAGVVAIERLVDRFRSAGLPVRLSTTGRDLPGDAGLRLAVYRIVQESLTNVLRHAPATPRVDVRIAVPEDAGAHVVVEVDNDGGPPAGAQVLPVGGTGQGIIGMRERAASCGGTLEAGPVPHGWAVRAALPATARPQGPGEDGG